MDAVQILIYILVMIFVVSFASKFFKYANMPVHLRWELYPIAGETKRPWGGSYLEDYEWWKNYHEEKSLAGEMKFMGKEILFFREYYEKNRRLWYIVYPFHIGVFLLVGFFGLLLVGALMMAGDIVISGETSSIWGKLVYYLTLFTGATALILGTISCLALLIRKSIDGSMRPYTRRIEYFNILFVLTIFTTGICSWAIVDTSFTTARELVKSLVTFNSIDGLDAIIAVHTILIGLFLAYLPYTNMMHFFIKHFTYNSVRWDDKAHLRGSEIEQQLKPLLEQRISWAAPHIKGINRWSDIPGQQSQEHHDRKEGTRHAKRIDKAE